MDDRANRPHLQSFHNPQRAERGQWHVHPRHVPLGWNCQCLACCSGWFMVALKVRTARHAKFKGACRGLREFWQAYLRDPAFASHTCFDVNRSDLDMRIPLAYHCDGAEADNICQWHVPVSDPFRSLCLSLSLSLCFCPPLCSSSSLVCPPTSPIVRSGPRFSI